MPVLRYELAQMFMWRANRAGAAPLGLDAQRMYAARILRPARAQPADKPAGACIESITQIGFRP